MASSQGANEARSVISGTPAKALLTGHPALAVLALSTKASSSSPGTVPTVTRSILVMVGTPSTGRSVTVASVCTDSGGLPASARMLDRAIEKQAACAAAISCSGFEPGPSSKRDLYVYPPLIVSPAVKVPVPVGTSPFHSALPFAGIATSLFQWLVSLDSPIELPRSPIRLVEPFYLVIWDVIQR